MNHLRELLDFNESNKPIFFESTSDSSMNLTHAMLTALGESAVCFDAGFIDEISALKVVPELVRLPYDICWIEAETKNKNIQDAVFGFFAVSQNNSPERISCRVFRKYERQWRYICHLVRIIGEDGKGKVFSEDIGPEITKVNLGIDARTYGLVLAHFLGAFLSALNCTNVGKIEHHQPEKLQKARVARGKKPLFSYWTLELKQERTEGDPLGGTHAPPRLHLRRGHPRQYAPGKYTWVQPCVVGNKSAGMVHKDYRMAA